MDTVTVRFLTPEWGRALEETARASDALREACQGVELVLQQEISGSDDDAVRYAFCFDDGSVSVAWGGVDRPDVTFVQSRETAEALSRGALNAQQAFVLGKLRVRGDIDKLVSARDAFVELQDVFVDVRARTEY